MPTADPMRNLAVAPPPTTPPTAASRAGRRSGLLLAGVGLLVAALVAGVVLWQRSGDEPARVALPDRFGAYMMLEGAVAEQLQSQARSQMAGLPKQFVEQASVGAYGRNAGNTPQVVVLVAPASAAPDADVNALGQIALDLKKFVAGPLGGLLRCGRLPMGAVDIGICAWRDDAYTGIFVSMAPALGQRAAAKVVNQLREALA